MKKLKVGDKVRVLPRDSVNGTDTKYPGYSMYMDKNKNAVFAIVKSHYSEYGSNMLFDLSREKGYDAHYYSWLEEWLEPVIKEVIKLK